MEGKEYLLTFTIFVLLHCSVSDAVIHPNVSSSVTHPNVSTAATRLGSTVGGKGTWQILRRNVGVVAMHMALTHRNTIIMFDQTRAGPSQIRVRRGYKGKRCTSSREDQQDWSCYAHAIEYKIDGNKIRPLSLETDTWCSSGSFLSNGTLLQTGGHGGGSNKIRYFNPCDDDHCNLRQSRRSLADNRWYASNLLLPDGDRVIVVGGKNVFSYEFVPRLHSEGRSFRLPFLRQTYNKNDGGNNLYPFLHLSSDGNLFIFANRDSILFNYRKNRVVKEFPRIPERGSRSYPSTGSSVILPLDHQDGFQKVEVMVCGGSALGAYRAAQRGTFLTALSSCGRMVISGNTHRWKMENMPGHRTMPDMLILQTGHILIINGAKRGCAGWNNATSPALEPYLYNPNKRSGNRFSVMRSTKIARMYHSSALLLPDGRVLVAGSNPNNRYILRNVTYPTELRLQAFVPNHMGHQFRHLRPSNVTIEFPSSGYSVAYGEKFRVHFRLGRRPSKELEYSVYAPPFVTHSFSMNQRLLKLRANSTERDEKSGSILAVLEAPPSPNVAPPGYYMLTVVNDGIPSLSRWIRFIHA